MRFLSLFVLCVCFAFGLRVFCVGARVIRLRRKREGASLFAHEGVPALSLLSDRKADMVRGEDGQKNVRVPRLLLEISIARLYSQFKEQHGEIIGERKFYDLLPANLRRMNGRRESCGCTEHIRMNLLQRTLNQWRQVQKAKLGPAYKPPEHSHVSFAVAECVCPDAAQGFAPAACWMRPSEHRA